MAIPFSIDDFKAAMADGGARPSLFTMEITYDTINARPEFQFYCRVSEIPGAQQNVIVQKFGGREIKFAGQRTYNNLTVTILNDESFQIRRGLEDWMDRVNGAEDNLAYSDQFGLEGDGVVRQFAKTGQEIATYRFNSLFPVNIAAIPLDWSNDGVIEEYTVEFAYTYWTRE